VNLDPNSNTTPVWDTAVCDREPIHSPDCIQPHGLLLALREPELVVVEASENTGELLGVEAHDLLGRPVVDLLPDIDHGELTARIRRADARDSFIKPLRLALVVQGEHRTLDGFAHRRDNLLILELEYPHGVPAEDGRLAIGDDHSGLFAVQQSLARVHGVASAEAVCEMLVDEVRRLTGFDRVMVYRFAEDGHGEVVAESLVAGQHPYMGLHYRSSDIPRQARRLYLQNWLRWVPDVNYQPVEMVRLPERQDQPLDLSFALLRSVSPIHREYLKNMGVGASMSISLVHEDRLWGMLLCHHRTPRLLSYRVRTACEVLASGMSLQVAAKIEADIIRIRAEQKATQTQLLGAVASDDSILALTRHSDRLLALANAQGAALRLNSRIQPVGKTPPVEFIEQLVDWLIRQPDNDPLITDRLAERWPEALDHQDTASGVLAVALNRTRGDFLIFFRPENVHTRTWGGNPHKAVVLDEQGRAHLSPDFSFENWEETVHQRCLPWSTAEIEAAQELRNALVAYVIRYAEELLHYNRSLNERNLELDAFAYVASHDLKEPLRGIHGYAEELLERYSEQLDDDGRKFLDNLCRLSQWMDRLLNSLLHFSRVNRMELNPEEIDLNEILDEALEMVSARRTELGGQIHVPRPLPLLYCDTLQVREIFTNLISNALKYNDKPEPWVEVGYLMEDPGGAEVPVQPPVFYVRDNGIGIKARYFGRIFQMFRRLHGPHQYGGGTGAGLTIVHKIVERHGGNLWLTSTPGEGTTFYFTLTAPGVDS